MGARAFVRNTLHSSASIFVMRYSGSPFSASKFAPVIARRSCSLIPTSVPLVYDRKVLSDPKAEMSKVGFVTLVPHEVITEWSKWSII